MDLERFIDSAFGVALHRKERENDLMQPVGRVFIQFSEQQPLGTM